VKFGNGLYKSSRNQRRPFLAARTPTPASGTRYESTDDLRGDFSRGTEVADSGDGDIAGPKDRMVVGMLLVLGFRWGARLAFCLINLQANAL